MPPQRRRNIQSFAPAIILGSIVLLAIVIRVFNWRLPAAQTTLTNTSNTNAMSTSQYAFPGIGSIDEINGLQARVVTNRGEFVFRLDATAGPRAASNFVYLARQKFYDGLTWHRVVADFVIQGGDPEGTGRGNPGYRFEDDPVTGEYTQGTVAMANSGPDTNGSQFFVMLKDRSDLPKAYSIFGHVTTGMDVVLAIRQGDVMTSVTIEPAS